ncbi:MAG: site-2 protease family protein [Candidatus Hadarchaeales archaeon]
MKELPSTRFECKKCGHVDYRMSLAELGKESSEKCPKCGAPLVAAGRETPDWISKILNEVNKFSEIEDFIAKENWIEIEVCSLPGKNTFLKFQRRMKQKGYLSGLRKVNSTVKIYLMKIPEFQKRLAPSIILLIVTIISTFSVGYLWTKTIHGGLFFSFAVMSLLGAHELGHLLAARENKIQTSPPYFIPFPSILGTMGAIVEMREPPPSRDAMVEIGSNGPIMGFFMSLVFLTAGLMLSSPASENSAPYLAPLIFDAIRRLLGLPVNLNLHPFAFAGLVMLVITFLNLMPLGQLDGGHIARAVLGLERHFYLTRFLSLALFFSGLFYPELPFWLWGLMAFLLFSRGHPGALDDIHPLSRRAKLKAAACLAIFILCFPIPRG